MSTPDIPAEAVEAANQAMWEWFATTGEQGTRMVLASALPHLREQWLAEVEGALRDRERFFAWQLHHSMAPPGPNQFADYLRDVLRAIYAEHGDEPLKVDVIHADGTHRYWSTHCRHGHHDACSATEHLGGCWRTPAECKTCAAPCVCKCHADPPDEGDYLEAHRDG